jgi:hypothetical protein
MVELPLNQPLVGSASKFVSSGTLPADRAAKTSAYEKDWPVAGSPSAAPLVIGVGSRKMAVANLYINRYRVLPFPISTRPSAPST